MQTGQDAPGRADSRHGIAAWSAVIGGALALASGALFAAAFGFDVSDVAPDLASLPADRAGLLRWGALADMFGFYLLSVPVALHLRRWLGAPDDAVMDVATVAGLLYACVGSIGAVVVASVAPPLLGTDTIQSEVVLPLVRDVVLVGLWQTLETIPWAVWMLIVAARLRPVSRALATLPTAVGAAALLASVGRITGIDALVGLPVSLAVALYPVWQLALGARLIRAHQMSGPLR